MSAPLLVTQESSSLSPILIVDKRGVLGDALARSLLGDFRVAVVTNRPLSDDTPYVHIPFKAKIPRIPDDSFSYIFLLFEDEKELISLLPEFSNKTQRLGAPLVLVTSIYTVTKEKIAQIKKRAPEALLFLYGDAGGGEIPSLVNHMLLESILYGSIKLTNTGLSFVYPSPIPFIVQGILQIVFGKKDKGATYLLFHRHGMTTLSFTREMKKVFPEIKIDLTSQKDHVPPLYIPEDGLSVPLPPLSTWITSLALASHLKALPERRVGTIHKRTRAPRRWGRVIFLLLLLSILLPFSVGVSSALAGGIFLKQGVRSLSVASFSQGEKNFSNAKTLFAVSTMISQPFSMLETLGIHAPAQLLRGTLGAGDDLATAGLLFVQAGETYKALPQQHPDKQKKDILLVTDRVKRGLTIVQRLEAQEELPAVITEQLAPYDASIRLLSATVDALPQLLGFSGKKTYLILFQNNKELRAGGGFIGSYGLLSVENGQISPLTLHDVYDADGQLKGHIEPPFALRRYLGASHWYLRDSNYSTDFPTNAEKAGFFLQKETGESVDGVLSVDATVLEKILGVTGPIPLPDYNQTLTSENAFLLLESKTQEKFFAGSRQKKSILTAAYTALQQKLLSERQSAGKLAQLISEQLSQKHILVSVYDKSLQKVLSTNNLSSAVPSVTGDPSVLEDFMGVSEMNLGQNKVNAYIQRSLEHTVRLDEKGVLLAGSTVTLTNSSTSNSPFGGDYSVYLRFMTPLASQFLTLTINGSEIQTVPAVTSADVYTRPRFAAPKDMELEKTEENGRTLYGVHIVIPQGEKKKITLSYALPGEKTDATFQYRLVFFKQPGTTQDPLSLTLTYPTVFTALQTTKGVEKQEGALHYEAPFTTDKVLTAIFARKK